MAIDTGLQTPITSQSANQLSPVGANTNPAPAVVSPEKANQNLAQIQGNLANITSQMNAPKSTPQVSVVDYLNSKGQPSDFVSRARLAQQIGIQGYVGSAAQNTQLLSALQNQPTQQTPVQSSVDRAIAQAAQQGKQGTAKVNPLTPQKETPEQSAQNAIPTYTGPYRLESNGNVTPLNQTSPYTNDFSGMSKEQRSLYIQTQNNANAIDNAITNSQNLVSQLQSGTVPLTADQQAQINALQNQFDVLRHQQLIANQNYTGSMTVAGIVSGRNMYAPEVEAGNVQAAVTTGIQKIGELDSKAASAIAQMRQGFEQSNFELITKANDSYLSALKAKSDSIQKMYDTVTAAQKDARDFAYKQAQDFIQNTLASDKFTYQQKQDAIDNMLRQQQLDETKRANLVKEAQAQQTINLQKQANEILNGTLTNQKLQGVPQTLSNGQPNPDYQKTFLSTLSPDVQNLVKGIANYTINPSSIPTRQYRGMGGLTQQQVLALVSQFDPTYDQKEYQSRQKFLNNWQAGGQNSVIQAANTATQHLAELKNYADKLGNRNVPVFGKAYNSARQWLNEQSGDPNIMQFKQTEYALAGELAKIYKNGIGSSAAPTDEEIADQLSIMSSGLSSDQLNGLIENGVKLMTDRLNSAVENYRAVMGKYPDSILYPSAEQKINELQSKGLNIDISKLNRTAYSDLSNSDLLNVGNATGTTQSYDPTSILQQWGQYVTQ